MVSKLDKLAIQDTSFVVTAFKFNSAPPRHLGALVWLVIGGMKQPLAAVRSTQLLYFEWFGYISMQFN